MKAAVTAELRQEVAADLHDFRSRKAQRREWEKRAPIRAEMDRLRAAMGLPLVLLGGPQ